jgi:predicted nucleic acid-binding protein
VLAETHQVLLRRAGIRPARLALDRIRSIAFLRLSFPARDADVAAGQWLDRLAEKAISYADAISFAVMEAERCRVALTFDADFAAAGFSLWRVP